MSRLVESYSERLRWMGLTQAQYDAIAGAWEGGGKAEGQEKSKGKEKAGQNASCMT